MRDGSGGRTPCFYLIARRFLHNFEERSASPVAVSANARIQWLPMKASTIGNS